MHVYLYIVCICWCSLRTWFVCCCPFALPTWMRNQLLTFAHTRRTISNNDVKQKQISICKALFGSCPLCLLIWKQLKVDRKASVYRNSNAESKSSCVTAVLFIVVNMAVKSSFSLTCLLKFYLLGYLAWTAFAPSDALFGTDWGFLSLSRVNSIHIKFVCNGNPFYGDACASIKSKPMQTFICQGVFVRGMLLTCTRKVNDF